MKALELRSPGAPADLVLNDDRPAPSPAAGEVVVRVRAAALNRVDQVIMKGYPGLALDLPHVLGADFAGEVSELGEGVSGWQVGQSAAVFPLVACGNCALCREHKSNLCMNFQYFGMHRPGGFAEYVTVPAASLVALPDGVDFATAACAGVAGVTALHALRQNRNTRPGDVAMIWGATGGVGVFFIQLAKAAGLKVIATTRQADAAARLQQLGADHVFVGDVAEVAESVRKEFPAGVDHVIDYVGPATFPTSHQLLKKGGTVTLCGILTGLETNFSIHQTYLRHLTVQGVYLGTREEYEELLGMLARGEVKVPMPTRVPLSEARGALLGFAEDKHFGKVVVDL